MRGHNRSEMAMRAGVDTPARAIPYLSQTPIVAIT
jgi:hypothetical protein